MMKDVLAVVSEIVAGIFGLGLLVLMLNALSGLG